MKHLMFIALLAISAPALAALKPGAIAPPLIALAALAGNGFEFNLSAALKPSLVLLYFSPAAFTQGCTLETREFVENHAAFRKAGATVIAVSTNKIETVKRFSVEKCRGKFAVISTSAAILSAFDAVFQVIKRSD